MDHQALTTRHMQGVNNQGAMEEMILVLKVNPNCFTCKRKLDEVLRRTKGQYASFTMDAEAQKVKNTGRVDPVLLSQVLSPDIGHTEPALIHLYKYNDSSYDDYYKYHHHYMTKYGNPYTHHPHDDPYVYNGHYQAAVPLHLEQGYYPQYRSHRCPCNIM